MGVVGGLHPTQHKSYTGAYSADRQPGSSRTQSITRGAMVNLDVVFLPLTAPRDAMWLPTRLSSAAVRGATTARGGAGC